MLCNDLHRPVFAAKELATDDVLSESRLEWGVGAGSLQRDELFGKPPRESTIEAFDRHVALVSDAAGER